MCARSRRGLLISVASTIQLADARVQWAEHEVGEASAHRRHLIESIGEQTMTTLSKAETEQRDEFVQRLFLAAVQSIELLSMYLGDRLGLYDTLHATGAATAGELAARAGVHER